MRDCLWGDKAGGWWGLEEEKGVERREEVEGVGLGLGDEGVEW